MTPADALERGARDLAVGLDPAAARKLLEYIELLAKWNKTYNLTAIHAPLPMVTHHLLDSLAVVPHLPAAQGKVLADVGSGAGLPGIPIAVARPDWRVTLNDASGKKAAFLRQAAIELRLKNVTVHEGRVEEWHPPIRFPVVISRAFARLSDFIERCSHLVSRGGWILAMKGALPSDELTEVPRACDCRHVLPLKVPFLEAERHLVLCTAQP
ncbi:MAG: 16S rRNA (guanine(527)-N(7))-methyltransferase RsmG [Betaproteobacteria bacterium]|nr:16S rRNA (guanine(527)-N(7))-methyltransferase RsmG [Betaproteobacteria bacterium]